MISVKGNGCRRVGKGWAFPEGGEPGRSCQCVLGMSVGVGPFRTLKQQWPRVLIVKLGRRTGRRGLIPSLIDLLSIHRKIVSSPDTCLSLLYTTLRMELPNSPGWEGQVTLSQHTDVPRELPLTLNSQLIPYLCVALVWWQPHSTHQVRC